jgi:hypothetical protein
MLQHAVHGYGLFWFHSFLAPAWPMLSYHFWIAPETRSPSMRIVFQEPQWWWQESRKAPDSLFAAIRFDLTCEGGRRRGWAARVSGEGERRGGALFEVAFTVALRIGGKQMSLQHSTYRGSDVVAHLLRGLRVALHVPRLPRVILRLHREHGGADVLGRVLWWL